VKILNPKSEPLNPEQTPILNIKIPNSFNLDNEDTIKLIEKHLGLPPLIARILVSRGIESPEEAETFLHPKLDDLSDPFLLPDIEKGLDRTIKAIVKKENICIYGDYDADGITATALMVNFFRHLELSPEVYLPKREEGYSLNVEAINKIKAKGTKLLICVDCGSSNVMEILEAGKLGMDVIVIDHHELPEIIPNANAIINPKRKDSIFPTRELAACGVTFFFLWALRRVMHNNGLLKNNINLKQELDIVTIGTLGDMVPLTKDNRILVKFGIATMKDKPRLWLRSFFKKNLIPRKGIDEYALNFIIIPRINATGRVSDPEISLRFLTSIDEHTSENYLIKLNEANTRRQNKGKQIFDEISETIKNGNHRNRNSLVFFNEGWHIGVIGIVAQKLVEKYGKPAIVITEVNNVCKGSGRGGDGFNLHEALSSLSPLLLKYGGHKYACGISLSRDNLSVFEEAFENSTGGIIETGKKRVIADAWADLEDMTSELLELIESLSPFGVGNTRPYFSFPASQISANGNNRVKVTDKKGRIWNGYNQSQSPVPRTKDISIIASPVLREDVGEKFIHLNIKEIIPSD
jgi:single-stranded-DNA-specific exonuclease